MRLLKALRIGLLVSILSTQNVFGQTVTWSELEGSNDGNLLKMTTFRDNWFAGVQAGGGVNIGSYPTSYDFLKKIRPVFGLYIGDWFSQAIGARLWVGYVNNQGTTDYNGHKYNWGSISSYIDGMFDLNTILGEYMERRPFKILFLFGMGMENTFDFSKKSWNLAEDPNVIFSRDADTFLGVRVGAMLKWRLSECFDFDVEANINAVHDAYDGNVASNDWCSRANLMVGLCYRFRNSDGSHEFTYLRPQYRRARLMEDEINRLRGEVDRLKLQADAEEAKLHHVRTLISFTPGSAEIDTLQQVNVYTAVQEMNKFNNNADLYITRNEDSNSNDDLFLQRATNIRERLVNRYYIPAGRIYIEKNPEVLKSINPGTDCVIVTINE